MSASVSDPALLLKVQRAASPMTLSGDPFTRGLGQAAAEPDLMPVVRQAVMSRIDDARDLLSKAEAYLAAQLDFVRDNAPDHILQLTGIAEGYCIGLDDLFAYLHLAAIEDANGRHARDEDGCSVVARKLSGSGPVMAKNRDYLGEHRTLQRVFLESDPDWGERRILAVGSLGSPGAFSSGMNSDGLALADTRIGWRRPGVGWLRYLLMNEVLIRAGSVPEALALVEAQSHVGGGALILMDGNGNAATVELGADEVHVTHAGAAGIGQTNHFLSGDLQVGEPRAPDDAAAANSRGRQARIDTWLAGASGNSDFTDLAGLMAGHDVDGAPALCRHGSADGSATISTALFACNSRTLYFCPGNPCSDDWRVYSF